MKEINIIVKLYQSKKDHEIKTMKETILETGKTIAIGIYNVLFAFLKVRDDVIVFDSNSGTNYTGNPRAIYEKLVEGYSKHDAYVSTVLTMKERYPDATYWASFVLLD